MGPVSGIAPTPATRPAKERTLVSVKFSKQAMSMKSGCGAATMVRVILRRIAPNTYSGQWLPIPAAEIRGRFSVQCP